MRSNEIIEFPANPFVALSDFLIMLLIILILVVLYQSVSNSKLMERMAISELQMEIKNFSVEGKTDNYSYERVAKALSIASESGLFKQAYIDGDLQRFWFDGSKCFIENSDELKSEDIKNVIYAFGYMLAYYQGENVDDLKTSLYKRIVVEGHAGVNECKGDELTKWKLSQKRALKIIDIFENSGVHLKKMEASARGSWGDDTLPKGDYFKNLPSSLKSQRFDVIIIYSGKQAMDYMNYQAEIKKTSKINE